MDKIAISKWISLVTENMTEPNHNAFFTDRTKLSSGDLAQYLDEWLVKNSRYCN